MLGLSEVCIQLTDARILQKLAADGATAEFIQGFIQRPLTCMGLIHGQVRQLRGYLASYVTSQLARHRNSNR
jgi:hypothetical protein